MKSATLTLINSTGHQPNTPYADELTLYKKDVIGVGMRTNEKECRIVLFWKKKRIIHLVFPNKKNASENLRLLEEAIFSDKQEASIFKAAFELELH